MSTTFIKFKTHKILILFIFYTLTLALTSSCMAKTVLTKNTETPYSLTLDQIHYSCSSVRNVKVACDGFYETTKQIHEFLKNQIYPKVPEKFLTLIQNEKIEVEFSPLNRGGLFTPKTSTSPLKINLKQSTLKLSTTKNRFAHEWFHALQSLTSPSLPNWALEGSAQLFSYLVCDDQICPKLSGESLRIASAQSNTSLLYPFSSGLNEVSENEEEAYGHTFLYFLYLYQSCGGEKLFWEILNFSGAQNFEIFLDKVIQKSEDKKWCGSFINSVKNAEIARLFNHFIITTDGKVDNHTLLIKEGLTKKFQTDRSEIFMIKESFLKIERFRPLLFPSSHSEVLKNLNLGQNYYIASFKRKFPYSITEGITENADEIFIMKINP